MAVDTSQVIRIAGYSTAGAIVSLILAGISIGLFFGGAGQFWGPINDMFTALTLVLLAPAVVAVYLLARAETGPWFGVVTVVALVGLTIAAVGQLLLVVGAITLQSSFITGGIGILPILVWAVALSAVIFSTDVFPTQVGWLLVSVLALTALTTIASFTVTGAPVVVASVALLIALVGWLGSLSVDLLARA
jgi:hypothetical protein